MNTALLLTNEEQKKMLAGIKDITGDGTLYSLDFTEDYHLEQVVNADIGDPVKMIGLLMKLYGMKMIPEMLKPLTGCSAFVCHDSAGHVLVGRNYDVKHDMTGVLLKSCSQGGSISSLSLVDTGWINYGKGDLDDGKHDNSLLMLAPYLPVEGFNAEGVMICVLQLIGVSTFQDTGKKKTVTTIAMRHALDKAKCVDDVVKIFEGSDMQTAREGFDYHFLVADKTGKSAVIEYKDNVMHVLDADRVTNFLLTDPDGELQVGRERYDTINGILNYREGRLEKSEVMDVLRLVSQPSGGTKGKSDTRWSVVYDLTDLTAELVVDHHYDKVIKIPLSRQ